jgi:hypothetical protein
MASMLELIKGAARQSEKPKKFVTRDVLQLVIFPISRSHLIYN